MRRARSGDIDSFGELLRRHERAALQLAAVITGSTDDAADIVQDAFINVHRSLSSWRGEGSVRSWLLRVVANQAKNHLRSRSRRQRREHREAVLATVPSEDPAVMATQSEQRARVAHAVGRLAAPDREVLGCRYFADLSEAEAATVLGVPLGTVKSRTSRALERLRAELMDSDRAEEER